MRKLTQEEEARKIYLGRVLEIWDKEKGTSQIPLFTADVYALIQHHHLPSITEEGKENAEKSALSKTMSKFDHYPYTLTSGKVVYVSKAKNVDGKARWRLIENSERP